LDVVTPFRDHRNPMADGLHEGPGGYAGRDNDLIGAKPSVIMEPNPSGSRLDLDRPRAANSKVAALRREPGSQGPGKVSGIGDLAAADTPKGSADRTPYKVVQPPKFDRVHRAEISRAGVAPKPSF
jgi:hypothetical protein